MSDEAANRPGSNRFMSKLRDKLDVPPPEGGTVFGFTGETPEPIPEEVTRFAPPQVRYREPEPVSADTMTRNQRIAEAIVALPYREAMAMGTGVLKKIGNEESGGVRITAEALTRAIQDWAWEWETFKDEERPQNT
jgi:hypothetical protein